MADWHEIGSASRQPEEPVGEPKAPQPEQEPEQIPEQNPVDPEKPRPTKRRIILSCIAAVLVVAAIASIAVIAIKEANAAEATELPTEISLKATTIQTEPPTEAEATRPLPETPEEKFWYCAEEMYTISHLADALCDVWEKDAGSNSYMDIKYLREANPDASKRAEALAAAFATVKELFDSIEQPSEEYADAMKTLRRGFLSCTNLVNLATTAQMWRDSYAKDRAASMNAVELNTNDLKAFAAEIGHEFQLVLPTEPEITADVGEDDATEKTTYNHDAVETAIKMLLEDQNASVQYSENNNTYYIFMFSDTTEETYNSTNSALASAREDLERSLDNLCLAIVEISGEHAEISYLSSDTLEPLYVTRDGVDITDSGVKY